MGIANSTDELSLVLGKTKKYKNSSKKQKTKKKKDRKEDKPGA